MSLEDIRSRNRLRGRRALPPLDLRFSQPEVDRVHEAVKAHLAALPEAEQQENRRNLVYTATVDAGSPHAYGERFAYHADALPDEQLGLEFGLMERAGLSACARRRLRAVTGQEHSSSFWWSVAGAQGRMRESVYGPILSFHLACQGEAEAPLLAARDALAAQMRPFELPVAWGLDVLNGALSGVKLYCYVEPEDLAELDRQLREAWQIQIPPAVWRLDQRFGLARRYDLAGRLSSVKLVLLNVFARLTPSDQLAEVVQPFLLGLNQRQFALSWDQIQLRSFNFDYSISGDFEKCVAYYYYPNGGQP